MASWKGKPGLILVLMNMLFGALMTAVVRLAQQDTQMRRMESSLVGMALEASLTTILSMYESIILHAPRAVHWLIVPRPIAGFAGIWGLCCRNTPPASLECCDCILDLI